jgi:uncharacterized coiled-coil protein SlyX
MARVQATQGQTLEEHGRKLDEHGEKLDRQDAKLDEILELLRN